MSAKESAVIDTRIYLLDETGQIEQVISFDETARQL
jgi:hypothetical protein